MKGKYRRLLAACVLPILTVTVSVSVALGAAGLFSKSTVVADDERVLQLGDNTVEITGIYPIPYAFTPEETGYYQFLSDNSASGIDPWASLSEIVDGVESYLTDDDDSGNGWNFRIMYKLTAGKTYYLNSGVSRDLDQPVEIGVNISKLPGLPLDVDTSVDLSGSSGYVYYSFTAEETDYYEFSILADNARPSRYLYDGNSNQVPFASQNGSSFVCKLEKGECYLLKIESGYNNPPITATVTVSKYTPTLSGSCGEDAQWNYDLATSTLTISGSGEMYNYYEYTSVTEAKEEAPWKFFRNDMQNLVIGSGITHIGSFSFYDCDALTSVMIPDGVTSLGVSLFHDCDSLQSATIGSGVTEIADHMFFSCDKLETVTISPDANITTIADQSLYCCYKLQSFTIPSTVTSIGSYAFGSCYVLSNVEIPSCVESIGRGAFSYCREFTEIVIPDGVEAIGDSTFNSCSKLASITIPDSVQSIGASAFSDCQVLTGVNIPDGIESIKDYTFCDCYALTDVDIPDSVQSIGASAFASCVNLTSVVIPEGVTSIESNTFYNCSALKKVVVPSTVKSIGIYAFHECYQLSEISFPMGLETIGYGAFEYCKALTDFTSGTELQSIEYNAFSSCEALKNVSIPSTKMTNIGNSAFSDCSALETATIARGSIGDYAFFRCSNLVSLTLGEGVTSIGADAFACCRSIDGLTLPSSLTFVGKAAFNDCGSIKDVYCYADPNNLYWDGAFEGNDFISKFTVGGEKQTRCHVYEDKLDKFTTDPSLKQVNVTYVGDLDNHILGAYLYGYSLSLDGDIGVNFYMDLPSTDLTEDAYVEFEVPSGDTTVVKRVYVQAKAGEDRTVAKTVPVGEKTYYVFKCQVSAKEFSSPIQAQMIDGDRSGQKYTYSVKSYADYLLAHTADNSEYAKAAPLVEALVRYCSWARSYFLGNNHIDESYLDETVIDAVTGSELQAAAPEVVIDLDALPGVTFEGATLSLKSETTLSLYFNSDEKLSFSCNGGKVIETARVNGYQVVRIRGIAAADIGDAFTVSVSCGGKTGTVRYSALNYISNVVNENYENELQCVVKALYLYYQAAEAYSA